MNAHQRAIARGIAKRKQEEENRKLIEKFREEGKSYCVADGKIVEVKVDVLDKVPPLQKRTPVTIGSEKPVEKPPSGNLYGIWNLTDVMRSIIDTLLRSRGRE